eukprot:TRINITY_DN4890_c0_g1_i4.p1 TRINITY_DN4890_c0_g1~~TRINITY_DN4890_c0_g1_i4.p1  ORF type:complete len:443 (-),score=105.70 TRINITY_DN4890_c0_g1_i4:2794-4122(-)
MRLHSKLFSFPSFGSFRKIHTERSLYADLQERGIITQMTHPEQMESHLKEKKPVYIGFDPTGESLHLGHLMSICTLVHFQRHGHLPIALLGGATGMIGDPSGRSTDRNLLEPSVLEQNTKGIHDTISYCLSKNNLPFKILNNIEWYKSMNVSFFLRDIGRHFRINSMIQKDSVRERMNSNGISFTEFSYTLLQAYDFLQLFENENCTLQLGGSDQWGNITSGTDLIHKSIGKQAFGMTLTLLTNSKGEKLGKSTGVGGSVWLSSNKTSPYEFYQYFMRLEDSMIPKFLRFFTFLPIEEIVRIEKEHEMNPDARKAQKVLAEQITSFVHGEEQMRDAKRASEAFFGGEIDHLEWNVLKDMLKEAPQFTMKKQDFISKRIIDIGVDVKIGATKGEIRRLLESNGLSVNGSIVDLKYVMREEDIRENKFCLIRSGKKNYRLILIE